MKKLLTIIPCVLSLIGLAQPITFDLSKKINITQPISPQKITSITIVNALAKSGTNYEISIIVKHNPTPPLSIPTGVSNPFAPGNKGNECKSLEDATAKIINEPDESQIPDEIINLQKELKNAPGTCAADTPPAQDAIKATTKTIILNDPITVNKGDELTITITRDKDNKWTFTYKNEQLNHWTTYYGFTYIPDIFTKFSNYYANQQTDGSYLITKMNGTNKNVLQNVSPTAMFTYRFFNNPDAIVKFGLTGGIFYNTEILGAMFGPSLIIGDNVTLNTGISFVQKYKLKGQYKDGQTIHDNLNFDQLHDKIWSYDMFISIGFNIPELFTKKNSTPATTPNH